MKKGITILAITIGAILGSNVSHAYIGGSSRVMEEGAHVHYEITRKEIEASTARTVQDLLVKIPGLYVGTPDGATRVVGYQGLSDQNVSRVLVYVDDFPVELPSSGSVYWNALPVHLEDIDRIVFYPSYSSSVFGETGFQGVLRIYTTKGLSSSKLVAEVGENGRKSLYGRANKTGSFAKGMTFLSASGHIQSSDGYHTVMDTDGIKKARVSLTHIKGSSKFNFSIGAGEEHKHEEVCQLEKSSRTGKRDISNILALASYTTDIAPGVRGELFGGINKINSAAKNVVATIPNLWAPNPPVLHYIYDDKYESTRQFFGGRILATDLSGWDLSMQFQYKRDYEIPNHWSVDKSRWDNEYALVSARVSRLIGNGVMVYAGADTWNLDKHGFGRINLLGGVNFKLNNGVKIRAGFAQAERNSNSWERFSQHYVYAEENPDLKAFRHQMTDKANVRESMDSLFVNLSKSWRGGRADMTLARLDMYNLEYLKFVSTSFGTGAYPDPTTGQPYSAYLTIDRGDRATVHKMDLMLKQRFGKKLSVWVSGMHVFSVEQSKGNVIDRAKTQPENTVTAGLNFEKGNMTVAMTHRYVDPMTWESAEMIDTSKSVKGYHSTDVQVRIKRVAGKGLDDEFYVGVDNLQGEYSDYWNFIKNDRIVYAGYKLNF